MKKQLIKGICTITALGIISCGSVYGAEGDSGFVPALDTESECEITVAGNYSNFESLEAEFDRFNEYYPDVVLEYVRLDDYNRTLSPALAGTDAPDIYCCFPWMIDREDYAQVFASAEDLADPSLGIDLSIIRKELLYTDGSGKVPMVPVFTNTFGMLVNEDIFAKEGITVPATYDELLKAAEALQKAGYENPIMGYNEASSMFCDFAMPYFYVQLKDHPEVVEQLNQLDPAAVEFVRPTLEMTQKFAGSGCLNLEACSALEDNYNALILRFFEGDIPMMFCGGDTISGTLKRESQSEAFQAAPFLYSYYPIPSTEDGGYFLNSISMEFAVNKDSKNLEMANEFMRFLISQEELDNMSSLKRLVTPTVNLSFDGLFAAFGNCDEAHTAYTQSIGLLDAPNIEIRNMLFEVGNGRMSVDEAIAAFGTMAE